MQQYVSIVHNEQVLRGMQHLPEGKKLPAVIMLHGFTGSKLEPHRFFLKISQELERKGIASFRFDFLGSGESDGDFEDMTILKELSEAKSILEYVHSHPSIHPARVYLLGFSMGGLVASLLAGELSDAIRKLVLLAPAGNMAKKADLLGQNSLYIEEKKAYDIGGNLVGSKFIEELKSIKVWERASGYNGEVLLIHGTEDQSVMYGDSLEYIEKCYGKRASLVPIEGADHTFNSFRWEKQVIDAVTGFLK
ncbi:alpha/beta hydrolase [Bacillus sp. REN3]|uniref:alpha/beta hydrolase family protein n=1 Tax=Bacillus sp. REN3 TaxID=2802440 RepID=UPI001AED99F6|nr:alpha/beta hydrolase [Bacillus sp. REN3]